MRKFFFTAAVFFAALFFCAAAFADLALYKGNLTLGSLKTIESKSGTFVPVADFARLLGFSSVRRGDELIMTQQSTQLRVINNSAAAWRGFSIAPLYSAPFEQDGQLWLDTSSIISLFQGSLGHAPSNKLSLAKISEKSVASSTTPSEIDFGVFDESAAPVLANSNNSDVPEIEKRPVPSLENLRPATPVQPVQVTPAPVVQAPAVAPAATPVVQAPAAAPTQDPVAQAPAPAETKVAKAPSAALAGVKKSVSKAQSKYETFKPDDSSSSSGESYSGTIQGIRWTSQQGNHKKIRAVIMIEDEANPGVFMEDGKIHALFASSLEKTSSLAAPFENIKSEVKKDFNGLELIFTPKDLNKVDKIILANPKRLVLDFFFQDKVDIIASAKAELTPVAQVSPPPTQTPVSQQTLTQNPTQAPDTLIIPTAPGQSVTNFPARRSASGQKTVVIDPGHGGKDPGASDNGVTEKDVNLAIGLELQRILAALGYNVVMTRNTDIYLKLQERTDIANNVNADLFVSIHVNALPAKKSATGFEIYIMALPTDKDAMELAKIENREYVEGKGVDVENVDRRTEMLLRILGDMQQNNKISESTDFAAALYNAGVRNNLPMRRVAQAPFFVLRGAGMPAVLLETGFVTNADESQKLTTQAYQQQIAKAMAEGIINYIQ